MITATSVPFKRHDMISRWPLRRVGELFLIEVGELALVLGQQTVEVIDVTDVADRLQLNQGQIVNGEVVWGPGEAYATVGSEGEYVTVALKDGDYRTLLKRFTVIVQPFS